MNYAEIKYCDIANGVGIRTSLFVSGCTHRCKNCFNSDAWDFSYGRVFDENIQKDILKSLEPAYIEGLSLLGGEPFEPVNQRGLVPFLKKVKEKLPEKTVWCYTGYTLETDLLSESRARCEVTEEMLSYIDVLVDGEFVQELYDISLRFKGSSNQRIIDVKKTLEIGKTVLWNE